VQREDRRREKGRGGRGGARRGKGKRTEE